MDKITSNYLKKKGYEIMGNYKAKKLNFGKNNKRQPIIATNKAFDGMSSEQFEGAGITHSVFKNCIFNSVKFDRAAVTGSIFERCEFINCSLDEADFEFCEFIECKISIKKVNGCSFNNSNFIKSTFCNIIFNSCTFTGTFFDKSEINKVKINYSTLEGACFSECKFKNLNWRDLNLEYIELVKPEMSNVILPFFQIPYIFGALDYLSNTHDNVKISYKKSSIDIDTYLSDGINYLLEQYSEQNSLFPIINIYLFGRREDAGKASEYLFIELNNLKASRDFRGIKFCCKLIALSNKFNSKQLTAFYEAITRLDISLDPHSAEMRSFARNFGEIRAILFSRKNENLLKAKFRTNIGIEKDVRFAKLTNYLYNFSKPGHSDKIYSKMSLECNSPLIITIEIEGEISYFGQILQSFLLLADKPKNDLISFPLVRSFNKLRTDKNQKTVKEIEEAIKCYEDLKNDGVELDLLEYYAENCDKYLLEDDCVCHFVSNTIGENLLNEAS